MTYVYIIIAILVLGFLYLMRLSGKVIDLMEENSKKAIIDAKENHGVELDLSTESLEKVNSIIQKLSDSDDINFQELSMIYGGYIGEVIRKLDKSGFWVKDHPEMGKDLYPVKFSNENYAFPVVWVDKHLSNGDEDNILHKYNSWKYTFELSKKA
ncbi:MAG: hypothetical protein ISR69_14005 [Gammaproteobacteria bacterium]|nr:hypothetical protein [Gammaproteobacteria bacterium]